MTYSKDRIDVTFETVIRLESGDDLPVEIRGDFDIYDPTQFEFGVYVGECELYDSFTKEIREAINKKVDDLILNYNIGLSERQ